jgi:multimeric flavodoxin WrbA
MKVVGFVGSPRKNGNTARLVNEVLRGAQACGAETQLHFLNEMNIKGCQACRACKKLDGACVQKDDMAPLYDEIKNADAVVIGTPVYMFQMTGQTKLFVDRLYAFLNNDFTHKLGEGKKTLMIYSQGQVDPSCFQPSFDLNNGVLSLLGFKVQQTIVSAGMSRPDDVLNNKEAMESAYDAGKAVCGN